MPVDKIYETELSLLQSFRVNVRPFEQHADRAVDLMLEFREMKRRLDINSADFHHLATATGEGCGIFVTTDERHLLREETREAFSGYVRVCAPSEVLREI
jgi:PIN domain